MDAGQIHMIIIMHLAVGFLQIRGGWTRPRDVYGIIAFQSTGLRECMGKAVSF